MSFDPSGRYQDRIESSANAYNNPYRQDRDSARGYAALHTFSVGQRDTIETQQQRLERHIVQKFTENHFRIPAGKLVAVVQVGRYLILAIVLPPYIFLYGAPKWLLAKLSPLIMQLLSQGNEQFQTLMLRISAWTKDVFGNILHRIQERLKKRVEKRKKIRTGDNLFQQLGKDLKKRFDHVKQPFIVLGQQIAKLHETTKNALKNIKQNVQNHVTNIKDNGIEIALQLAKSVQNYSKQTLEKSIVFLKPKIDTAQKVLAKIAKVVDRAVEKTAKPIIAGFSAVQAAIPVIVIPVWAFLQQRIFEPAKDGAKVVVKPLEVFKGAVIASATWAKERIVSGVGVLMNFGAVAAQRAQQLARAVLKGFDQFQKSFIEKARIVARALKYGFEPVKEYAKKLIERSKEKARQHYRRWKEAGKEMLKKAKKGTIFIAQKAKRLPGMFYRVLKKLFSHLYHGIKKTLFGIRLVLTWIKILVRYSLEGKVG